jgi:hypothetical protein
MTQEAEEFIQLRSALEKNLSRVADEVDFNPDLLGHHLAELHGYCTRTAAAIADIARGGPPAVAVALREIRASTFDHLLPHHIPELKALICGLSDAIADARVLDD